MAGVGLLPMSRKEGTRLIILPQVQEKTMTMRDASQILGISYRNRGLPSSRATPPAFKQKVVDLYQKQYGGFGPTLAAVHPGG